MAEFEGLIVGGPKDGERMRSREPFFRAAGIPPVTPARIKTTSTNRPVPTHTFVYRHTTIRGVGRIFGFWIPERRDDDWLVARLIRRYAEESRRENGDG